MKYGFFLLLTLGLLSCKNNSSTPPTEENSNEQGYNEEEEKREPHYIELKTWELNSYTYEGKDISVDALEEKPTINFDHKKVNGFGACNNFMGDIEFDAKGNMKVGQVARSKKLCQKVMGTEARFMELLEAVASFKNNQLNLELDAGEKGKLNFVLKD